MRHAGRIPQDKPVSIPPDKDLPTAITWTTFQVCEWVKELGYPQYMVNCFIVQSWLSIKTSVICCYQAHQVDEQKNFLIVVPTLPSVIAAGLE